jgi:serine/threonine protein kinase
LPSRCFAGDLDRQQDVAPRLTRRGAPVDERSAGPSRADNAQFLAEARVTARCNHENIVVIYNVGEHGQQPSRRSARPPSVAQVWGLRVTMEGVAKLAVLLRTRSFAELSMDERRGRPRSIRRIERLDLRGTPMSGSAAVRIANARPDLREPFVEHKPR